MSSVPDNEKHQSLKEKLQKLTQLLLLEQAARQKQTALDLGFVIVNNTHRLCPYTRCLYWTKSGENIRVLNASGISKIEKNAPFQKHYIDFIKNVLSKSGGAERKSWARLTEVEIKNLPPKDQKKFGDHLKNYVLVIEFISPNKRCFAGISLESERAFDNANKALLEHVCESYAHALYSLKTKKHSPFQNLISSIFSHKKMAVVILLLVVAMFIPVKLSVTVPAEIIARNPYIISTPIEGVIKDILIKPNQQVKTGMVVALLDDTDIRNKLEIAIKELKVLDADLDQSTRSAFKEKQSKAQIAIITAQIERKNSEIKYFNEVLTKTKIIAPQDGVAIFSDPNKIRGQHYQTGQKIMILSDPKEIELEIRIPSEAMIAIDRDASVELFLNEDPLKVHEVMLIYIEYQASQDPDGLVTYKAYADITSKDKFLSIGSRGTAKIYGAKTILANQIFRRPLISLRRHLML